MKTRSGRVIVLWGVVLVGCPTGPVRADETLPTGEQVMERHVKSIGGKDALKRIKTQVIKGKIAISAMGQEQMMTFTKYAAEPNKMLLKIETQAMGTMEQGTDGRIAWAAHPMGVQRLSGVQRDALLREAVFHPELEWRELYKDVQCVELTDFDGMKCYKVVMTPKEGDPMTTYYEQDTWLMRGLERETDTGMGQKASEMQIYKGYKEVDGVLYPFTIQTKVTMGPMTQEMTITRESIEHNVELPADQFNPPAAAIEQTKAAEDKPAEPEKPKEQDDE